MRIRSKTLVGGGQGARAQHILGAKKIGEGCEESQLKNKVAMEMIVERRREGGLGV